MANILFLVHRIPYPPNKGDKVRSYNLLLHLALSHRIYLGTFVDDPEDEEFIAALEDVCVDSMFIRLQPLSAKINSLRGLISSRALSIEYYKNDKLRQWVKRLSCDHKIDYVVIFSSSMAQYADDIEVPCLIDFVDVDSLKWKRYAATHAFPLSWLYERESRLLLQYERESALTAAHSFFVTQDELALFNQLAPECSDKTSAMNNGVDSVYFCQKKSRCSLFGSDGKERLVFTGAMDYLPNIDAVIWFVANVLPLIKEKRENVIFYIVGRNPTQAVQALASSIVVVTGTVIDVRPYLQFADVVVAPLRIARGMQNKILEAMAMERPVVASISCAQSINEDIGNFDTIIPADTPQEYCDKIVRLLDFPELARSRGEAGRKHVLNHYSWFANMSAIDPFIS